MKVWAPQKVFEHQPDAVLNQPSPDQNKWYTVLEAQRARIYAIVSWIEDVDETLEFRLTIDGNVYIGSRPGVAWTEYWVHKRSTAEGQLEAAIEARSAGFPGPYLEGRNVKFEARKTTAAGTGNLVVIITRARLS